MKKHENSNIVITGAGRGLGLAYARHLASEGASIGIAETDGARGQAAAKLLRKQGANALFYETDVSSETSTRDMTDYFIDQWGRIDGLVANAGLANSVGGSLCEEISVEQWDKIMAVNVRGTWLTCRAVIPFMKEQRCGSIVTIGSDTALWGSPRLLHYVTSKGAIVAFTRAMARELGEAGIRINCIAPGLVRNEATAGVPDSRHEWNVQGRALARESSEDDIVGTVSFLLSEEAAFITGQLIVVDGGLVFH